ncbi:MAG: hypothetical protein AAFV62_01535 [Pseudomonadota bacterium]
MTRFLTVSAFLVPSAAFAHEIGVPHTHNEVLMAGGALAALAAGAALVARFLRRQRTERIAVKERRAAR